tara:strand:+ start:948 stop:1232 length:285 start_codon:yes stop_codon:yes gene_type:complete
MATTKKSAPKKAPAKKATKKTGASPVGRPKNLVKLTAKDVPSGVSGMIESLAHSMELDAETVVTLSLLHVYQQQRVMGQFGVKQLLERQKVYLV